MTPEENLPNLVETKTETSLDVLRRIEGLMEEMVDSLNSMRFYVIGTFVTIAVIGALYAFFLVYALVILPRAR